MRACCNKSQTCRGTVESKARKPRGKLSLRSSGSVWREGKGEVLPGGWAVKRTPLNHSIWEICLGGVLPSCEPWRLHNNSGIGPFLVTDVLRRHFWFQPILLFLLNTPAWLFIKVAVRTPPFLFFHENVPFQVAAGRGNCTPHRNPTPCTIPQEKESIFHSIFSFFTKSGRKVLVRSQGFSLHWAQQ